MPEELFCSGIATKERTGGALLVECLVALGATKSFGVPGESYLAVLDALYDSQGTLDYVLCRNEGGAAFMGAAYGKLTGKPGICFVTRGPGASNASIGVHTAMQDSSPMLLFVGQVPRDAKGREAFQEVDYRSFFGSVAKWVTEVDCAGRLPEIISRAWTTAVSGRPGPVIVALPEDMLTQRTAAPVLLRAARVDEAAPAPESMKSLAKVLADASRPVIIVGGGGWKSSGIEALQMFAERSDMPVLTAFRRQDLFDNHSSCYVGGTGLGMAPATEQLIRSADVVVGLNLRFGEMTTSSYGLFDIPLPTQRLIHIHASARELGKIYVPELAIHAGPNQFAEALADVNLTCNWSDWRAQARHHYEASLRTPAQPGNLDMGKVMRHLQQCLPHDAIMTNGAGCFSAWPNMVFKFGRHQRLLGPQSGAMGYGIPAAIAASVAQPDRTVICFSGDGDFQMNLQELGTAVQARVQPIILLVNNGIYGSIRMHQELHYPQRVVGTTLQNPDFVALAKAYGIFAEVVTETDQFAPTLERALRSGSAAVIELRVLVDSLTPRKTLAQFRESGLSAGRG